MLYACRYDALFSNAPTYPLRGAPLKFSVSFFGHSAQSFWIRPSFWSWLQNRRPSLAPGMARSRAGRVLVGPIHPARSALGAGLVERVHDVDVGAGGEPAADRDQLVAELVGVLVTERPDGVHPLLRGLRERQLELVQPVLADPGSRDAQDLALAGDRVDLAAPGAVGERFRAGPRFQRGRLVEERGQVGQAPLRDVASHEDRVVGEAQVGGVSGRPS